MSMSKYLSRRDFVKNTALAAAVIPVLQTSCSEAKKETILATPKNPSEPNTLTWVDGVTPLFHTGTAFGVPWAKGLHPKGTEFAATDARGQSIPVQTWVTATWPDGSVKWTGHALSGDTATSDSIRIAPGKPAVAPATIRVQKTSDQLLIDTGKIRCTLSNKGETLIHSIGTRWQTDSRQRSPHRHTSGISRNRDAEKSFHQRHHPYRSRARRTHSCRSESIWHSSGN